MATGNDIRTLRSDLGWSTTDLAVYWGVNRSAVGYWEAHRERELPRSAMFDLLIEELRRSRGRPGECCKVETITGEGLRIATEQLGITIQDLANLLGANYDQLKRYIRGDKPIAAGRRFAIAIEELRRKHKAKRYGSWQ